MTHDLDHARQFEELPGPAKRLLAQHCPHLALGVNILQNRICNRILNWNLFFSSLLSKIFPLALLAASWLLSAWEQEAVVTSQEGASSAPGHEVTQVSSLINDNTGSDLRSTESASSQRSKSSQQHNSAHPQNLKTSIITRYMLE